MKEISWKEYIRLKPFAEEILNKLNLNLNWIDKTNKIGDIIKIIYSNKL